MQERRAQLMNDGRMAILAAGATQPINSPQVQEDEGTYFSDFHAGDKYRRLRARLTPPKAVTAMAHQLARIIWTLITRKVPFDMSLFSEQEKLNEQRRLKRLAASARHMGYQLTPLTA